MQVQLKVLGGSHDGKLIAINDEKFLIGRSDSCQLRPKSESISRKHCVIVVRDGRVLVQDLKSRNGTRVNESKLPTDRAKKLRAGDVLQVGKLKFEIVIEHGLSSGKRPAVNDIGQAAARTAGADGSAEGSKEFVPDDVSAWLDEADQIERVRRTGEPETIQFRVDKTMDVSAAAAESDDDMSIDTSSKSGKREKKKPGKLPDALRKPLTDNSRDAADDALKRLFTR